ncbi:MAG: lactate racemase domain-containing protein, partial [Spirochaetota bacterium]|nr:lactate racemase domain-containing protein [Spirochaetota bacterium]
MKLTLPYGRTGLELELPDSVHVVRGPSETPLADPAASIAAALEDPTGTAPLRSLLHGRRRVAIIHSDITRATPNALILPPLLSELERSGVS